MWIKRLSTKVLASGLCAWLTFGFLTAAVADDAPVFQHALEYQPPEPYEVVIYQDGELEGNHKSLVEKLEEAERGNDPWSNITVKLRDGSIKELSNDDNGDKTLPLLELRYPPASGIRGAIWEGPLEEASVEELLHSPVRQQIAEELLDRKAAVWVFLEGENEHKNERALESLEEVLSELEAELHVSVPDEQYGEDVGEIYTDIDFSIILLDREDPREQLLVKMLMGLEDDLSGYKDKPMAFPVYGRGAVMYALIGDGINDWTLRSAAEYLADSCESCGIGASATAGTPLLMSVDWSGRVEQLSNYEDAERRYGPDH